MMLIIIVIATIKEEKVSVVVFHEPATYLTPLCQGGGRS